MELPIASVVVGDRSRREMRNIASLAESIRERGCLHPPVVRREGRDRYILVAGARRLAAMKSLGYDKVTVTVTYNIADELAALYAEGEENTEREPFTPSEAVAHAERIEGVIAATARERQVAALKQNRGAESTQREPGGKTRDLVAKATGMSHPKLAEAREVIAAAEDPDLPEPVRAAAAEAVAEMDVTGNVHGAVRKVREAKKKVEAAEDAAREDEALRQTLIDHGFDLDPPADVLAQRRKENEVVGALILVLEEVNALAERHPAQTCAGFGHLLPDRHDFDAAIDYLTALRAFTPNQRSAA